MGLVRQLGSRPAVYEIIGRLLFLAGMVLGCLLVIRFVRKTIDAQISQQSRYLVIASTPMFELPPATPLPTLTLTPTPTATPPPLPAIRLSIPAINLNSTIEEVSTIETVSPSGEIVSVWDVSAFAVGHYLTSGNPGGGQNIVLAGHNNTLGEVFRDLNQLSPGDEVILFTEEKEFHYLVEKKYILPFLGDPEGSAAQLQSYAAPQPTEMVTLISCWPYATNANRIVIIAVPTGQGG